MQGTDDDQDEQNESSSDDESDNENMLFNIVDLNPEDNLNLLASQATSTQVARKWAFIPTTYCYLCQRDFETIKAYKTHVRFSKNHKSTN